MGTVRIRHPELAAESDVVDESVPVWLELGWVVVDDGNTEPPASPTEES